MFFSKIIMSMCCHQIMDALFFTALLGHVVMMANELSLFVFSTHGDLSQRISHNNIEIFTTEK